MNTLTIRQWHFTLETVLADTDFIVRNSSESKNEDDTPKSSWVYVARNDDHGSLKIYSYPHVADELVTLNISKTAPVDLLAMTEILWGPSIAANPKSRYVVYHAPRNLKSILEIVSLFKI